MGDSTKKSMPLFSAEVWRDFNAYYGETSAEERILDKQILELTPLLKGLKAETREKIMEKFEEKRREIRMRELEEIEESIRRHEHMIKTTNQKKNHPW